MKDQEFDGSVYNLDGSDVSRKNSFEVRDYDEMDENDLG